MEGRHGKARDVCESLLAVAGVSVGGAGPCDIQVRDERLWERLLRDRELGLAESYMDGWWDVAALDELAGVLLSSQIETAIRPTPALAFLAAKGAIQNRQTVGRSRRNARAHYDIGNDLYERMLDKRMVYSCAYWHNATDLEAAQEAKLDLICRKLHLEPGLRLLDIGCGWGAFSEFAAQHYGVSVVGLTPAREQARVARQRCEGLSVEIREIDYREMIGQFDRITSIGMMEHVGPRNLPRFFATCDRLLAPGGLMLHHTIGAIESKNTTDRFFDKYIFPGGVVPSLVQISSAIEGRFVVDDLHSFGPDYDRTLMAWHANIEAAWSDLPDRYDERFRRMWRYYLLTSAGAFRVRDMQLWQFVMRRVGRDTTYQSVR